MTGTAATLRHRPVAACLPVLPAASNLPVDLDRLVELIGDDAAATAEILLAFRQSAEMSREALTRAVAGDAVRSAQETAHNLKSAARAIGAVRLGEICAVIEEMARAARTAELRNFFPQFRTEMDAVCEFLDARRPLR